ncbi:MAG TPA: response regulator transcription factor [Acidobacteriota bacterium]|nr:response regulator transcription factor [Acidobacteriota bacterium]
MNHAIRVLVVDDNQLFCEAASALLNREHRIEVIGTATSQDHAVRIARSTPTDVALIGPNLLKSEALRLIGTMKAELPDVRIVASGIQADKRSILAVIEAGASDYVLQNQPSSDLVRCIVKVGLRKRSQGRSHAPPARMHERPYLSGKFNGMVVGVTPWLTTRQTQILRLMAEGRTNKEIADELGIALSTVKNHIHQILTRFGVESREEAVRSGFRSGILT